MIRFILEKMIRSFEQRYGYDASYMHEINSVSTSATIRLFSFGGITNYRGKELPVWGGAALGATMHGDCGPCAQLMVDRLLELELAPERIQACLQADYLSAGSMGLGYQFAQAVLANSSEIEVLAEQIKSTYGQESLIAAAYAASTYSTYPLLKRALGQAQSCQLIKFNNGSELKINKAA
jgi:hypothetical protein